MGITGWTRQIIADKDQAGMWKVTIDRDKCTDCGECMDSCPGEVYDKVGGKIVAVNQDECHGCHTCEAVCPEEACSVEEE